MRSGGSPAGSGRVQRLDPFALPVRFAASDATADGRVREIELHRERVVVRRSVRGMPMAINMPLSAFAGVALQIVFGDDKDDVALSIVLHHKDPLLVLPLLVTREMDDAFADWRCWGQIFGLPLLVEDENGLREPFKRMGQLRIARVRPRRRRRSVLRRRRPSIFLRRIFGKLIGSMPVHRGEREIIARN
jgi:hypothetical protein